MGKLKTTLTYQASLGQEFSLWQELKQQPAYQQSLKDPCYFSTNALGLRSPLNLPDIEKAVDCLHEALASQTRICVVGDRDVDGISSTALIGSFLREKHLGERTELWVSDDGDDYGLSGEMFERVRASQAKLVILLDMGSSHGPEIETLAKEGKKIIVLDHHQLHDRVPDPRLCAFINPQRNKEEHPGHGGKIATVGLVFKLLFAYALSHISDWNRIYLLPLSNKWHAFRCGHHLHSFACNSTKQNISAQRQLVLSTWQSWQQENLSQSGSDKNKQWEAVILQKDEVDQANAYNFLEKEWQLMSQNIDHASRLLLAYTIESRPRLRAFIQKIADIAAIGTLCDMVPLTDENRALVRIGIGRAMYEGIPGKRAYRVGYTSMLQKIGLNEERITSRDLAWSIGPTLNAAGRMGNSKLALELLLCKEENEAKKLARKLVKLNEERKQRTKRNQAIISQHLNKNPQLLKAPFLFCYHPELEPGVSGIIASRLTEEYEKPVIYINNDGPHARGSARSCNAFNVLELLSTASELFIQFGGHIEAAGFSVSYENISALQEALYQGYDSLQKEPLPANNATISDAKKALIEIKAQQLKRQLLNEIDLLEPFGAFNPEPVFCLKAAQLYRVRYMTEGLHAFFRVAGCGLRFIAWRKGGLIKEAVAQNLSIDLHGCLEKNKFRGKDEYVFRVEDIIIDTQSAAPNKRPA